MSKGPLKLADLRSGRSDYEDDMQKAEQEYNFGEHKQKVIDDMTKKYGNVYNAVFEMNAMIESQKVQIEAMDEMIDWDKVEEEE
tara:strand:- start:584 stop:835 length:252 start_codon:yes stop_codon:yes gene_type:complete